MNARANSGHRDQPSESGRAGGYDLLLDLAVGRDRRVGARAGLEAALREAVRDGRLAPGTLLPSSRTLARDLGLARNTVADAYGQLVAEGWLTARQGSGTRVAARQGVTAVPAAAAAPRGGGTEHGMVPDPVRLPYSLWPGSPDVSAFPRAAWSAAARRALTAAPSEAFGYSDPRGRPELREALAAYLARVRGVRVDPELLVICTGFVQAIGLLARVLYARGGRRIAVEELGFPDTRTLLRVSGLKTVPLALDADGARVDGLGDADAVLLTPAHQFPTGVPLSPERRTAVVDWARATGGLVIEDDYDGEFRYDRQPVGALQGLAPEHVVYAGTASKSLAPGLRLAWITVPPHLRDAVVREKRMADHHSPVIDQLTLAEFIGSGAHDRHVRRMRLRYRARRDRLVATLGERVPSVRVSGIAAGLHAVVELPPAAGPLDALVARARERGLALGDVDLLGAPESGTALVIGYATPPDHAFGGALDLLCEVLAEFCR
ncbi:GntR family transcriptional regulator / MocR family aminotransferase [Actinacidiphila yanglinensis]|uniref:GntR family transcriptional regulator / MocR family aminotransferase n=1 Tax=Actinacidiphila yanglinensis TaxID=310779 RepID=A0A1H6BNN9_9ACTN|nr:PLP-dependent aminotransferase family protein [Actinacidiphila yanglinensis]SEG62318.1 GntR family transcriptional regulator / MocR family aminotransferase [Actinacidiphila yanglinensis]